MNPCSAMRSPSIRLSRVLSMLALAVAFLLWGAVAKAEPPAASSDQVAAKVSVTVVLIAATHEDGAPDPKLKSHAQLLRTLPFRSYTYLDEHTFQIPDGGADSVSLREGRRLSVKILSHDHKEAKLHLELTRGDHAIMDTKVTVHRNRWFSLGVRKKNGTHLVVPVHVTY